MFQNLLGLLRRTKDIAQVGMSLIPGYLANLLWLIETSFRGLAQKGYGQNAAVYACLRILSESVPEPPMLIHTEAEDGTLERIAVSHDLQQLIRKPNELQTEFSFWELVTLYLGISGRAVIWKERDNLGRVIGRWPLRPDRVGPIYSTLSDEGAKVVKGFSYQIPGTMQYLPIPRSEIELYLVPDPAGESGGLVEGLGPLQVLAREVSADNEATNLVGALLANYAQPSLLIKTTIPIPNKEQAQLIKESFRMQMGGAHRGEPAVLDGNASIEKLSFDLQQLEFPNLRDLSESRIAAAFGVPAILAGLKVGIQAAIKATIEEQRELFTEGTLSSYWRRYQDTIDRDLCSEFGTNLKSQFDTTKVKALQHQAKEEQDKIAEGYQNGAATLDEYRTKVLGLPELGGTIGKLRFVASVGQFVDDEGLPIVPPPAPAPSGQGDQDEGGDDEDDQKRTAKAIANALVVAMKAGPPLPKEQRRRLLRLAAQSEQAEISLGAALQPRIQATLDAQRDALVAALPGAQIKTAAAVGADSLKGPESVPWLPTSMKAAYDAENALASPGFLQALKEMDQVLTEGHTAAVQLGWQQTTHELGQVQPPSLNLTNPHVAEAIKQAGTQSINGTTLKKVRAILRDGAANGSTFEEMAQALNDSAGFEPARAKTIARTESGMAYGRGAAAAMRDLDTTHVQITDGDDWDEPCIEANGTVQTIEWYEANLKEHPNCTRAAAPVPEADAPKNDHGPLHLGYARFHWLENSYKASQITAQSLGKGLEEWAQLNGEATPDAKQKTQIKRDFQSLQHAAQTQLSKHEVLYRPLAIKDLASFKSRFKPGQSVMLRGLGEAYTSVGSASSDALDFQKAGWLDTYAAGDPTQAVPVVVELHNPGGIIGYDLNDQTTLVQNGATYRVKGVTKGTDGVYHVQAWSSEKAHQPIIKAKPPKKSPAAAAPEPTAQTPSAAPDPTPAPASAPAAASTPSFAAGDQVEVVAPGHDLQGQTGTLIKVSAGGHIYTVEFANGDIEAFLANGLAPAPQPTTSATNPTTAAQPPMTGPIGKWIKQPEGTIAPGSVSWSYQHASLGSAIIVDNGDGTFSWSIDGALTKSGSTDSLDKAKATSGAYFSKAKAGKVATNPKPKPSAKKPVTPQAPGATPQANLPSSAAIPTANPQSAPAPIAAPPPPQNAPQPLASSTLPFNSAQLVLNTAEGQGLGGAHPKTVYTAPDGSLWLFKPQDAISSAIDVATWRIADLAGFDGAKSETYALSVNGQSGSIQRMHGSKATRRDALGKFGDFDPTKIDADDALQLQKHAVFDWLISNHDGHAKQFVRVKGDRTIYAIDKGQAFKFFGQDKLDPSYQPNAAFGVSSVYNQLHQAWANGQSVQIKSLKNSGNAPLRDFIKQLQSIDDSSYREALRRYAEQAARRSDQWKGNANGFLDAAVARKNNLLSDFEQLYARLDADRDAALAPRRAKVPAGLQGMDGAREFASNSEGQRYGLTTWPTWDNAGFTDAEKRAVLNYKGSGYGAINGRPGGTTGLRNGGSVTAEIKAIDVALHKHPFPEDTTVLRGTDASDAMPAGPATYVGKRWEDKGFLSTSLGSSAAFGGNLKLTIRVPAGTPTYYLDHTGSHTSEREVLLPRSAQYFVHSAELRGSTWEVEMEMIPNSYPA